MPYWVWEREDWERPRAESGVWNKSWRRPGKKAGRDDYEKLWCAYQIRNNGLPSLGEPLTTLVKRILIQRDLGTLEHKSKKYEGNMERSMKPTAGFKTSGATVQRRWWFMGESPGSISFLWSSGQQVFISISYPYPWEISDNQWILQLKEASGSTNLIQTTKECLNLIYITNGHAVLDWRSPVGTKPVFPEAAHLTLR